MSLVLKSNYYLVLFGLRALYNCQLRLKRRMTNEVTNYFLAPIWNYAPQGPIALGNIVRAPNKIVPPLYAHTPSESDPPVTPSFKEGVSWSKERVSG